MLVISSYAYGVHQVWILFFDIGFVAREENAVSTQLSKSSGQ